MKKALPNHYPIHIFTLLAISVIHPVLNLLVTGDHATFFVAHQSGSLDVWLLVLFLSVVLPLTITAVVWLAGKVSRVFGMFLLGLVVFLAASSLFSMLLKHFSTATAYTLPLMVLFGIVSTWLYLKFKPAQLFITLMSPAILLVPVLFITNPNIKALLETAEVSGKAAALNQGEFPNVVIIIFDELPLWSLLDGDQMIDGGRYPNFLELAENATWYRGATTIHYSTRFSIPSILTGTDHWERFGRFNVDRPKIMLATESFPENVFSLLENSHKTIAFMSTTTVGGLESTGEYTPPLEERLPFLLEDMAVLFAYEVVPSNFENYLPPVFGQWQDFSGKQMLYESNEEWNYKGGKPGRIKQLLDAFQKTDVPGLYVAHVVLPHHPFRYNEQGQLHDDKSKIFDDGVKFPRGVNLWPNEESANSSYQAHLLQLGFVDRLLGKVINRLKTLGMYDDSLIIVTADHGISFYWNRDELSQPELFAVQASEVLYVPLLIKAPGQTKPRISDKIAQTVDILPTIAEMLGITVPWELDGVSLLDEDGSSEARFAWLISGKHEFPAVIDPRQLALERRIELFGNEDYESIYNFGPQKQLVNDSVSNWDLELSESVLRIFNDENFQDLDPLAPELPAYVEGEIDTGPVNENTDLPNLAVSVNGIIRSTSKARESEGKLTFLFRLPPESFEKGPNQVAVYEIVEDESGSPIRLRQFTTQ